ncbi:MULTISPECIES: hypothetical protein [unclassified Colwellia]|uniref:hypothetical protein n=1 Tax=unclassified Colwellia TaxID=196834 RepID=UPI0015F5C7F0|nr:MULTISPECIES: hypothetical protein [unclassified Colwellia]MBA6232180.1 hypothetical protein [Colwellia sp. MB02u-7]MBA6237122.1 hypothetical protein [Colwellia sp. MB02u-11]MBA6301614.1 hypothetical protein [Colwellia sp. MB3u-22]MBA6311500.1 hypothetical protein [Colwellia sp. MB3u-64]
MDLFNNREIATGIWLLIILVFVIRDSNVRNSFRQLFSCFFVVRIQIPLLLMLCYSLLCVYLLNEIDLWDNNQIKNVVFWFFGGAAISFFNITNATDDKKFFTNTLKGHLKLIVIIQFVLNVYTFNFFAELALVAIASMFAGVIAFSKNKAEYEPAHNVCEKALNFVGVIIIMNTVYQLVTNWGAFSQTKTMFDFLVPTLLSIMLLPFLYCLATYVTYGSELVMLKFHIKDNSLRRYAFLRALIRINFRYLKLKRWMEIVSYSNINNKTDVNNSIDMLFRLLAREENPPEVNSNLGWCPYQAKDFLTCENLITSNYKKSACDDNDWYCETRLKDIEEGFLANNIAYYVEGNEIAVTRLKLRLNINQPCKHEIAHDYFANVANKLIEKALNYSLSLEAMEAIKNGDTVEEPVDNKKIKISKDDWGNSLYGLKFVIEHQSN